MSSSYRDIEKYKDGQELAKIKEEEQRKEKIKQAIFKNIKLKTFYDPTEFFESLIESTTDKKVFSRKTKLEQASELAGSQMTINLNANCVSINNKLNEMIDVINKCCESDIQGLQLAEMDHDVLRLTFLEHMYKKQEAEEEEKRRNKSSKSVKKEEVKTKAAHKDKDDEMMKKLRSADKPKEIVVGTDIFPTMRRLISGLGENESLFEQLKIIGNKLRTSATLSEQDNVLIETFKRLYDMSNKNELIMGPQILLLLIFGFIINQDGVVEYRIEYEDSSILAGANRLQLTLSDLEKKNDIKAFLGKIGYTNLRSELTNKLSGLSGDLDLPRRIESLKQFGSQKKKRTKKKKKTKKKNKKRKNKKKTKMK
tara:strand:- start:1190 stop:2293 length:1104 start_codon:yes stop_codon:yes gene_type:complete